MEKCKYCNSIGLTTKLVPPHIGLYCEDCGKFQHWIKQEHNIDSGEIASETQQNFALLLLKIWKNKGVPMTKRQAGAIIQAFKEV